MRFLLAVLCVMTLWTGNARAGDCDSGVKGALLSDMLSAGDQRRYSEALRAHGSVHPDELPCIVDGTTSWRASRRRWSAETLALVRGPDERVDAAQMKAAVDTSDVVVWAIVVNSLLRYKAKTDLTPALNRPKLITKALAYETDDKRLQELVQRVGLTAGMRVHAPGIDEEVNKRLDSPSADMVIVALNGLAPEVARAQLPKLKGMLEDFDAEAA